jgi:hypothetical protein
MVEIIPGNGEVVYHSWPQSQVSFCNGRTRPALVRFIRAGPQTGLAKRLAARPIAGRAAIATPGYTAFCNYRATAFGIGIEAASRSVHLSSRWLGDVYRGITPGTARVAREEPSIESGSL